MASVNPLSRELVFKIVYYGPGLGGKTTTLEYIHATAKPDHKGKLVSLATPVDRTLYFDFLPMRLPPIRGMHVRLQLFTVPGQVYFNATRKLVLTGADGIVFVADSQTARADANLESLDNLRDNLADQGRNLTDVPIVFQYNKFDLDDVLSVEELDKLINRWGAPSLSTSAKTGLGVYESLEKITHAVLGSFETQMPESVRVAAAASFDPNEEGLAAALRGASQGDERQPASAAIFNRIATSRVSIGSIPPETGVDEPAPIEKSAVRAAAQPVMTFPEQTDDSLPSKEKLAIAPASEASILTKGESTRTQQSRSPESRSFDSQRSRTSRSVLPPKPFAPLIPHAGASRPHAPAPPSNATVTHDRGPAPPPNATVAHDRGPAPPPNATVTHDRGPAPPPNATVAAKAEPVLADKPAPTTEKTGVIPDKSASSPGLQPPHKTTQERLDPTELFSIADLLEPSPIATRLPQTEAAKAPEATAKPEPVAAKPEPVAAKPEPVAAKPEPVAPKPEPVAAKPEPVAAKPEPVAPKPEPVAAKPEPVAPKPEPVAAKPEPVAAKLPKPIEPEPLAPAPIAAAAKLVTADEIDALLAPMSPPIAVKVAAAVTPEAPPPPPPPPPKLHSVAHAPVAKTVEHHSTSNDSATPHAAIAHAADAAHAATRKAIGLSFAELWPESDRILVHEVEAAIAAGRCSEAIDLSDALVTRILTSTATLFGSTDASRDATTMPPLLGIDGRRYLAFRSIVRAARSGAKASSQDALAAYAFAIEARTARSSVR